MLIQKMSHTPRSPRPPGREKDRTGGDGVLDVVSEALGPGGCDPMGGGTGRGRQLAGVGLRSLQARGALRRVRRLRGQLLDTPGGRGCVRIKPCHPRRSLEGRAQRVNRGWSGLRASSSFFVSFFFFKPFFCSSALFQIFFTEYIILFYLLKNIFYLDEHTILL